jgi:23S rRNA (adenine2503-C2)-methyltransferase
MGMGEPMNNYDAVMASIRMLNDPKGIGIGVRHLSISTCGIVPGILKLADEPEQVNLAISLHSAVQKTRSSLMPVNAAYPIEKLMAAVETYTEKTNRKVLFEYLLLDGINDTRGEAEALADLLSSNRRLYQVNLLKYHDTHAFKATSSDERGQFMQWLIDRGIPVTIRHSFGEDILAACGQLAVMNQ